MEILAVHATLLHNGNVLYFSGSQHDVRNHNFDANRLWNPTTRTVEVRHYPTPASGRHNLFCCSSAFLENGGILAAAKCIKSMKIYNAAKYLSKEYLDTDKFMIYSLLKDNNFGSLPSTIYRSLIYLGSFMKIFIAKYIHKTSISRQSILNFVGAHPRLTTIVAALGISFTFASIGRFAVHEAFALTTATSFNESVYNVPNDHITSFGSGSLSQGAQYHNVVFSTTCAECAKDFAPGQEATSPGDAQNFAPGDLAKSPGDASNFAPGELKKKGF